MTHFFNELEFPEGSRMTGVWINTTVEPPTDSDIALGQLIDLPIDQDPVVESSFTTAYLPYHVGGFHGTYADGQGWIFVLQKCPADSRKSVGANDPTWPMIDALERVSQLNQAAEFTFETTWNRKRLINVYASYGIEESRITAWSISELMWGLLAQCCYAPLDRVVDGHLVQCAFLGTEHDCQGDVFSDVFARWQEGLLTTENEYESGDGWSGDYSEPATVQPVMQISINVDDLQGLSRGELIDVADTLGYPASDLDDMSNDDLIDLILAAIDMDEAFAAEDADDALDFDEDSYDDDSHITVQPQTLRTEKYFFWSKKKLGTWTTKKLRRVARESGMRKKDAADMRRKDLIKFLATPSPNHAGKGVRQVIVAFDSPQE